MTSINNYSTAFLNPSFLYSGEGKIILFDNFDFNLF